MARSFSPTKAWGMFTLAFLTIYVLWLSNPSPALAHSRLLTSNPVPGASLEVSPQEIDLSFSESVSLEFSSIKIYDRARREQPVGPSARGSSGDMSAKVTVTQPLQAGVYTVVWRVVSAVDGHVTAGSFAFRVRAAGGASTGTTEPAIDTTLQQGNADTPFEGSGDNADPIRWVIRGLILITSSLLLGGAIFTVLILEPTVDESGATGAAVWSLAGKKFGRIGAFAAGILIIALALDLVAQVASVAATGAIEALSRGDIASVVMTSTRYGFAWGMKIVAASLLFLIMLFVWLASKRGGNGVWELVIALGSIFLLAESLSSHAAAATGEQIMGLPAPIISDWLHLVTAAAWVGGLVYMGLALFPAFGRLGLSQDERKTFLALSVPRFSRVAVLSVVTLVVTGTYNLLIHSNDLGAILRSGYGQVLLIKHVLLAALIVLGAINLLKLTPRLRTVMSNKAAAAIESAQRLTPDSGPVGQLGRNVRAEMVLLALVLVCAGGLTLLPPPSAVGSTSLASAVATATPGTFATAVAVQPTVPITMTTQAGGLGWLGGDP